MPQPTAHITDYIPAESLQRIMDTFRAVTGYTAVVRDTDGEILAESAESPEVMTALRAIQQSLTRRVTPYLPSISIRVGTRKVGAMVLATAAETQAESAAMLDPEASDLHQISQIVSGEPEDELEKARRAAAVQLMFLLADAMAQVCRQGQLLHERVEELTTLVHLSKLLAGQRGLRDILNTITRSIVELMGVKAAAIRMITDDRRHLVVTSTHNLSSQYIEKGPISVTDSLIDQEALSGKVVYVKDMTRDERVMYREEAAREGLASMLAVGMVYRGQQLGVMRVYTDTVQVFSNAKKYSLRAIAQLAAAAVRNAQLDLERQEKVRIQRQVQLGAEVQRRLLPQSDPDFPPFDAAGRYEPCFDIGGDFFDFIPVRDNLGVVIGDVVGKGIAAGMLMATVRGGLRAHVEDVWELNEVMNRANSALSRDTRDHEFATVFYGVFDRNALTLTYCSAGHEPVLLLRGNEFTELSEGGLPLGVIPDERYQKGKLDLMPGDLFFMYTDGLMDATSFGGERFGRERVLKAILETRDQSAATIVNHVLWEVRRFVGMKERFDDITLVALKVNDAAKSGT